MKSNYKNIKNQQSVPEKKKDLKELVWVIIQEICNILIFLIKYCSILQFLFKNTLIFYKHMANKHIKALLLKNVYKAFGE